MSNIEIKTTFEDKNEAIKLLNTLLDERLISCGQISEINSIYNWNNERVSSTEYLVLMKSRIELLDILKRRIKELHSYDLPEIIYYPINGSKEYLDWIDENTIKEIIV